MSPPLPAGTASGTASAKASRIASIAWSEGMPYMKDGAGRTGWKRLPGRVTTSRARKWPSLGGSWWLARKFTASRAAATVEGSGQLIGPTVWSGAPERSTVTVEPSTRTCSENGTGSSETPSRSIVPPAEKTPSGSAENHSRTTCSPWAYMRSTQARKSSSPCRSTIRRSAVAPAVAPATMALMSPSTSRGKRLLARIIRWIGSTSRPASYSFTPGKMVPSWKTSMVSVQYGFLPPMSSQCAFTAEYPIRVGPWKTGTIIAASCGCEPVPNGSL